MASEASTQLRLGTRQSALALAQSGQVARALEAACPGVEVTLVPIVTRGDREPGDLAALGGKGLFTRELEEGLLAGTLDLAVHSLKDLPVALPEGLTLAAFPRRADPRDALISEAAASVASLPRGAVVWTGSLRRRAQLLAARPDLDVQPIRGNVDTRIAKWRARPGSSLILAQAGLDRLGAERPASDPLPVHGLDADGFLPAPGQGILALEVRAGGRAEPFCRMLDDEATRRAALAERAVVAAFGGDCTLPLAAYARTESDGGRLRLSALLAMPDGTAAVHGQAEATDPAEAAARCVAAMNERGAAELLAAIRGAG